MDFQSLQNDVLAHHFSSAQYLQIAKDKINEAQAEVAKRIDLRVLEKSYAASLAAGTQLIDLAANAADLLRIRWLKDENVDKIVQPYPGGPEAFAAAGLRDFTSRGAPESWATFVSSLYFYPLTPSASYGLTVHYYKQPATLSANGDVPEIPDDLHHLLITYAVSKCFQHEGDLQQAQAFMAMFRDDLGRAAIDYQWDDLPDSATVQVPGTWG